MHFTYQKRRNLSGIDFDRIRSDSKLALVQGDIIDKSKEVMAAFEKHQDWYLDDKYVAYCVLTQTCDLAWRKDGKGALKPPRADYLNLAVVRDAVDYLSQGPTPSEDKLARLINQNELGRGLFYLHNDPGIRLPTPWIVDLRVIFTVRTVENYEVLVRARCAGLTEAFAAKLGWMAGYLFSRPSTKDWDDEYWEANEETHLTLGQRTVKDLRKAIMDKKRPAEGADT